MKTKRIAYCHPGASFNDCYNAALSEDYDEFLWNGSRFPVRPTEEGGTATKPTCAGHPIMWGVVEYAQPVDRWLEGWRAGREAAANRAAHLEQIWAAEARAFDRDGSPATAAQRRARADAAGIAVDDIRAMAEPDGVGKPDTTVASRG